MQTYRWLSLLKNVFGVGIGWPNCSAETYTSGRKG